MTGDANDPHAGRRSTSFWAELKRRHVYRVAVVYAAVAFGVWQVADILVPTLGLPSWIMTLVVIGPILTFPFAMILAWAYDITPAGIRAANRTGTTATPEAAGDDVADAGSPARGDFVVSFPAHVVRRGVVALLLLLAVVGGGSWFALSRSAPEQPALSEVSLAVFPFTVRGSDRLAYLREGIVDLLSRNLSGATAWQPLDPSLMLSVTGGLEPGDPRAAGSIARRVGAGQFVTGTVNGTGAMIRIDASLFTLRDSVLLIATRSVQGDTTQLFDLIDQLTAGLLSELTTGAASERMVRTAATTTPSLAALKSYLEGEQQYRQGKHDDAADAFQRALEADSAFALARYRLAMTYHMRGEHDAAYRESELALRDADRLTAHDRRVMSAFHAFHAGAITDAERQLRAIVREYPRDLEARVILAELLGWYAPARAEPLSEARRLLEEVLEADPKFMCVYCQLAALLEDEGDLDGADRLMRQLHGRDHGDTTTMSLGARFYSGAARGDSAVMWQALAEFDTIADSRYAGAVANFSGWAIAHGRFREAEAVLAAAARRPQARTNRVWRLATLHMARGEWRAAGDQLAALQRLPEPPPIDRLASTMLINSPLEMPIDRLDALREQLVAWNEGAVSASPLSRDWPERLRPASRLYFLGLIAARSGDDAATRAYADSLTQLAVQLPAHAPLIGGLAHVVRADYALRAGDARAALRELERVDLNVPPSQRAPWTSALWHAAQVRVHAHLAADEPESALRWLRHSIGAYGSPGAPFYGTYQRDMAYVLDALDRREEAALHYARFAAAWERADPELQPQVTAALDRLRTLTGERRR
jgi:thioredoxin-like negative regulator of GroEL/TolB-like protein